MDFLRAPIAVAAMLLFALPSAEAIEFPHPDAGGADAPVSDLFAPITTQAGPFDRARGGDPLRSVDRQALAAGLLRTGSLPQAVQDAGAARLQTDYAVTGLGDANKDGQGDFILETIRASSDPEKSSSVHLDALAGESYKTLWKLDLPEDTYWYWLEDVTGDGVREIVTSHGTTTVNITSKSLPVATVARYEYTTPVDLTVYSGADLSKIVTKTCVETDTLTFAYGGAVASSASYFDFSNNYCGLDGFYGAKEKGFQIDQQTYTTQHGSGYAAVAFLGASMTAGIVQVDRLDAGGKPVWSMTYSEPGWYGSMFDESDFTGDGLPDYLVRASTGTRAFGPAGPSAGDPRQPKLMLYDGATGKNVWTINLGQVGDRGVGASVVPVLKAPGADIITGAYSLLPTAGGLAVHETVTLYDGTNGAVLSTKAYDGSFFAFFALGDGDHDGLTELLMQRIPVAVTSTGSTILSYPFEYTAVKPDFTPVWGPLKIDPRKQWLDYYDAAYAPDFDGDGSPELTLVDSPSTKGADSVIHMLSGATGKELWNYVESKRAVSYAAIPSLDGKPGMEAAITTFDIPEQKAESAAPATVAAGPSASAAPASTKPTEVNYANYAGWLELRRGSDNELMWRKQVYDPTKTANVSSKFPYASLETVPDLDHNGVPDLLYNIGSNNFNFQISPDGQFEVSRDQSNLTLSFALVLEGANGTVMKGFPDYAPSTPATVGRAAPVAAKPLDVHKGGTSPGLGFAIALGASLTALAARRRHA